MFQFQSRGSEVLKYREIFSPLQIGDLHYVKDTDWCYSDPVIIKLLAVCNLRSFVSFGNKIQCKTYPSYFYHIVSNEYL